jgi:hypothetical protein
MGHALNLLGLLHQFLEGLFNLAEVFGVEVDEFGCQFFVAVNEDDVAEFVGEFNLEKFQVGFPLPCQGGSKWRCPQSFCPRRV